MSACSAVAVDPYVVPWEDLSDVARRRIEFVLADVAAVVALDAAEVRSSLEVYDFLLSEMPFTSGVVRELGRGTWDIFRDPEKPERDVFYVMDPAGMRMRFELVHREPERRFYVARGSFEMGPLPALVGSTVVAMRTTPAGDRVKTDAVVYVRVETPFYAGLAKGTRGMVESRVKERAGYFIRAARWVAEEAAARPDWLYTQVNGSKRVDQDVLEKFRALLIK
ncbi:MAG TPA: hypothetical protein VF950_28780 [Planctomycetota bacterium]